MSDPLRANVVLLRPNGDPRTEEWEKTEWFCVGCGEQQVWEEPAGDDYYLGTPFLCASCGSRFSRPMPAKALGVGGGTDSIRMAAFAAAEAVEAAKLPPPKPGLEPGCVNYLAPWDEDQTTKRR